jgi:hypothetical protein
VLPAAFSFAAVTVRAKPAPFYDLITCNDLTLRDRDRPLPWPPSLIRRSELKRGADRLISLRDVMK